MQRYAARNSFSGVLRYIFSKISAASFVCKGSKILPYSPLHRSAPTRDFVLHCGKLQTKNVSRKNSDDNPSQDQLNSPETCTVFKIFLTYAHILRFPRISLARTLQYGFASFSRKSLETMFCLIWTHW